MTHITKHKYKEQINENKQQLTTINKIKNNKQNKHNK